MAARASARHQATLPGSAAGRTPYRAWGTRASSCGVGRAVRTRSSRYTCMELALTMVPQRRSASARASADLPLAVGPATSRVWGRITRRCRRPGPAGRTLGRAGGLVRRTAGGEGWRSCDVHLGLGRSAARSGRLPAGSTLGRACPAGCLSVRAELWSQAARRPPGLLPMPDAWYCNYIKSILPTDTTVMAGEGPPSTTLLPASRKDVHANLRRRNGLRGPRLSLSL